MQARLHVCIRLSVNGKRYLIVTADDYGSARPPRRAFSNSRSKVGSRPRYCSSIHRLPSRLFTLAPTGQPVGLGWHPCLTLDAPVLPARLVPSLVNEKGRFSRWASLSSGFGRPSSAQRNRGRAKAQLQRLRRSERSTVVNSHHHVRVCAYRHLAPRPRRNMQALHAASPRAVAL